MRRLHLFMAVAAMFGLLLIPSIVEAQRGGRGGADQPPAGPTPRLADGKPDLS